MLSDSRDPKEVCEQYKEAESRNISNDVFMIILKQILLKQTGLAKLVHLKRTSKRTGECIDSVIYTYVKSLTIIKDLPSSKLNQTNSVDITVHVNDCTFTTEYFGVVYDNDDPSITLNDTYLCCLKFLMARVNQIKKVELGGMFNKRMHDEFNKVIRILESPKVVLKHLHVKKYSNWSVLLGGIIKRNMATLQVLCMDHPTNADSAEKSITLIQKKFTISVEMPSREKEFDQQIVWFEKLINGHSKAKKLVVTDRVSSGDGKITPVFINLIQELVPKSIEWNGVWVGCVRWGTLYAGDITEEGSWLQYVLANKKELGSIQSLSIEQCSMDNWGESPFTFSQMKSSFPNLQKLRITCLMETQPAKDIVMILNYATNLFKYWPGLDAIVRFTSVTVGMDEEGFPVFNEFSEQDKASVYKLPEAMKIVPNLANVSMCPLNHEHLQLIMKIESIEKAKVFCKFALQKQTGCGGFAARFVSSDGWASVLPQLPDDQACILAENPIKSK